MEDASIEHSRLRNIAQLADASAYDKAQQEAAWSELESLKEQIKDMEAQIQNLQIRTKHAHRLKQLSAKYSVTVAQRILALFPMDRYEALIQNIRDETQLKDVTKYFHLVVKGCQQSSAEDNSGSTRNTITEELNTNVKQKRLRLISDVDEYFRFAAHPEVYRLLLPLLPSSGLFLFSF